MSLTDADNTRSKSSRVIISVALVALCLLIGGGTYFYLATLKQPVAKRETAERIYNVDAFVAERVDVEEIISGFGTARCDREVVISAQVSGEVVEIHPHLKVGASVSDGTDGSTANEKSTRDGADVLAKIDARSFQERVTQAENRLNEIDAEITSLKQQVENNTQLLTKAEGDYAAYEKEYERIKRSRAKGVATATDVTRSLLELQRYRDGVLQYQTQKKLMPLQIASARQRQQALNNDLRLAQMELARTEIRPPFNGRLSEVMVEVGQFVRAGEPISRLSDLGVVEVAVPLPLADYEKLEPAIRDGQQPAVRLAPNETAESRWTGNLVRIAPEADQDTRTVKVFVRVDNREQESPLLPGTFVNVRIDGPVLRGVVPVPRDAIHNGNVYVAINGNVKVRQATTGRMLQTLVAMEDTVQPGERVILTNLEIIFEDAPVEIQRTRRLQEELDAQRSQLVRVRTAATE